MTIFDHLYVTRGEKVEGRLEFNISLLSAYINWGFSFNQPLGVSLNGRSEEFRIWRDLGILVNHVAYAGRSVGVDDDGIKWLLEDKMKKQKTIDIELLCKSGYVQVDEIDGRSVYFLTDKILKPL